jgi:hypothetical protein
MCGIFVCFGRDRHECDERLEILRPLLKNRGPDGDERLDVKVKLDGQKSMFGCFVGCVLWLRGR